MTKLLETYGSVLEERGKSSVAVTFFDEHLQAMKARFGSEHVTVADAIVSRAVFVGMTQAVREMKRLIREAAA